jgi:hypothetical protein
MDALNAMVHLAAAIAFLAMGFWAAGYRRQARRLLRMAQWQSGAAMLPKQVIESPAQLVSDLCLVRGVQYVGPSSSTAAAGPILLLPWWEAIKRDRLQRVEMAVFHGKCRISMIQTGSGLSEQDRKELARSVAGFKIVELDFK